MTTKKKLIAKLLKAYPEMNIFEDGNGWVRDHEDIFSISAEDGGMYASNGYPLMDYWIEDYKQYTFGVHNEFEEFLEKEGWYSEWVNPGVLAIVKNN